ALEICKRESLPYAGHVRGDVVCRRRTFVLRATLDRQTGAAALWRVARGLEQLHAVFSGGPAGRLRQRSPVRNSPYRALAGRASPGAFVVGSSVPAACDGSGLGPVRRSVSRATAAGRPHAGHRFAIPRPVGNRAIAATVVRPKRRQLGSRSLLS